MTSPTRNRSGFTITELLIAMAITLLMMGALTQAFSVLGRRMKESRADIELSTKLRNVMFRLREELAHRTVKHSALENDRHDLGYLVYYDGPTSDSTSIIQQPDGLYSKWGDLDDYLAFTAKASDGAKFVGKVPEYMLWRDSNGDGIVEINDFNGDGETTRNPYAPVTITSEYAEIIYFVTPEYEIDTGTQAFAPDPSGAAFPDEPIVRTQALDPLVPTGRVRLHRRVLLIRPDLNYTPVTGTWPTDSDVTPGVIPRDASENGILPYYVDNGLGRRAHARPDAIYSPTLPFTPVGRTIPHFPATTAPGAPSPFWNDRAWLIGMSPVHQHCDLSVRRVLDNDGRPTDVIAANSLEDLSLPHNRFGFVRMPLPNATIGGFTRASTTLPVLALGRTMPMIARTRSPVYRNGNSGVTTYPFVARGFLRPEFALGQDRSHIEVRHPSDTSILPGLQGQPDTNWGQEREGEDVVAEGLLAFDLRIFDRKVVNALVPGRDGQPGRAGYDDDGGGTNDDWFEMGAVYSDDLVITTSDIGMNALWSSQAILTNAQRIASTANPAQPFEVAGGGFTDLDYVFQVGGPIQTAIRNAATTSPHVNESNYANTEFSGAVFNSSVPNQYPPFTGTFLSESPNVYNSGKHVITPGTSGFELRQPLFDTWTRAYQDTRNIIKLTPIPGGGTFPIPTWFQMDLSVVPGLGMPGSLDQSPLTPYPQVINPPPPFPTQPGAIQVKVRIQNSTGDYIRQMTVSESL